MKINFLTRKEYHEKKGNKLAYGADDCPFCKKDEQKGHTLWQGKYWYILHNISPYSGDEQHIMAVPYDHIELTTELKDEHFLELREVYDFVKEFFNGVDYFSFTRETMSCRSIEHLHIQFLAGKLQGKYLRKMLEKQGFPIKQDLVV